MNKNKKSVNICFAVHADYNITNLLENSDSTGTYKVFFSNLYSNPSVPFTLAFSGGFLEWAQKENSHFFDVISEMLDRKQIEILGNAFFEPFMSTIPVSDLTGQIEHMTDTLRKKFYKNKRPRGLYLPYFAWNPNIIHIVKKCNFDYCLLDTRFFLKSGLSSFSPVCLEDSGKTIFGIPATFEFENTDLTPSGLYDVLTTYADHTEEATVVVFLSPENASKLLKNSNEKKSWMEEFLEISSMENSIISIINASRIIKNKSVYQKGFIASNVIFSNQPINSSVKQLLVNKKHIYEMYAKMNYIHTIINQIKGDKIRKKTALFDLWKAEQAILFNLDSKYKKYNQILRAHCYRNLLLAEKQTRVQGIFTNTLSSLDFDLDGVKEFLSQREKLNMYVHSIGGKIFELDTFNSYKNYADISSDDTGLFIDHLVTGDELELIKKGEFPSAISKPVFSENFYQDLKLNRAKCNLLMKTDGHFRSFNQAVSLKKQYNFNDTGVSVQYIIKNESKFNLSAYFMVEIDLSIHSVKNKRPVIYVYSNEKKYELTLENSDFNAVSWIQIKDPEGKSIFTIESNENTDLVFLPIYEKTGDAQNPVVGVRNLFYWRLDLVSGYETEKMLFFNIDVNRAFNKNK